MKDISINNVIMKFGIGDNSVHALGPIDMTIAASEFIAVVGPSGCGKSTLMQLLAGLVSPTSGEIRINGQIVEGPSPDRTVVFQKFALFPSMTVENNVGFGLKVQNMGKDERSARVAKQLNAVGLTEFSHSYPHQLSGGMQQRVAIARALILEPQTLLLDEPFGALDAQTRTVMQEDLADLTQKLRTTTVLITHSVEEATYLADKVLVMSARPGRIKKIIENPSASKWRSRGVDEAMQEPDFNAVREEAWTLVREEITVPGRGSISQV